MKIVTVIPLTKGVLNKDLTYFTSKDVFIGNIVSIPVRNKTALGLVVFTENATNAKGDIKDMNFNLKKIIEVKENSIFSKEYLESAVDTSKYFLSTKSNTITSLIPSVFLEKYDEIAKFKDSEARPKMLGLASLRNEKFILQESFVNRISIYKTLIRENFALKKSIYIVLPTESDIKNFEKLLSHGIEQFTFALYGKLALKKILKMFEEILTIKHPVLIIGTAPFLSIPRNDIGVIILEHESSNNYKIIGRSHIDLRIFIELFASKISAKLILGDTLLRYETITRSDIDGLIPIHPLSFRIKLESDIEIPIKDEKFKILSNESIREIQTAITKERNTFIFTLRKGLATQTICRDCNETINCDKCMAPVVLYQSKNGNKRIFSCNRCKRELDSETKCTNCGSWNLMPLGIGIDTVFEEVKKLFPLNRKIFKLDKETAKTPKGAERIVKEFEKNSGAILIGTEMAFSYLKEKVPLSIIASFDSLWSIPNFKMSEKIIKILIAIIEKTSKKIIIQTKNENDPAILAVRNQNLLSFMREELKDRKNLNYPPYKRFIKIVHLGSKEETLEAKEMLKEIFKEYNPEIFSGFVSKIKDKYVTNALIKIEPKKWSLPELSAGSLIDENLSIKLLSLPHSFEIFADSEDLL